MEDHSTCPICGVLRTVPLARIEAVRRPLAENPGLAERHAYWARSRAGFLAEERDPGAWQRDYTRGADPGGERTPGHATRLGLRAFRAPTR